MQWLRLYDDVLDDPKIQQLSPVLFKHWINLLCLANKGSPRGTLPHGHDLAFRLRVSPTKASDLVREFYNLGLLDVDGDVMKPHNWDERQRKSDNVAERVAKHRGNVTRNVTTPLAVTPPDTDTDTEQKQTQRVPPVIPQKPEPPKPEPSHIPKPRTDRQKAADVLYERRFAIFEAYCRGVGMHPESVSGQQSKSRSLNTLTVPILDSPECEPGVVEALTIYTVSAYDWRHGKKTPSLAEVLAAFPEWDQAGRPERVDRQPRAPTPITRNGTRPRDMTTDEKMAEADAILERKRQPMNVIDVPFRHGG